MLGKYNFQKRRRAGNGQQFSTLGEGEGLLYLDQLHLYFMKISIELSEGYSISNEGRLIESVLADGSRS